MSPMSHTLAPRLSRGRLGRRQWWRQGGGACRGFVVCSQGSPEVLYMGFLVPCPVCHCVNVHVLAVGGGAAFLVLVLGISLY
jgi:hypothetical protein